jgi:DNA transformation protein and related proteins
MGTMWSSRRPFSGPIKWDEGRPQRAMAVTDDFFRYVLEQLSGLRGVASRRMFGAVGLYSDGAFFGLISSDVLYFKVGDSNRPDYEARGMSQFRPYRDRPQISMSYYEVPAEVLEDVDECMLWAQRSIAVAHSAPAGRPLRPSRRPKTPSI